MNVEKIKAKLEKDVGFEEAWKTGDKKMKEDLKENEEVEMKD